jgi:hypothetical protein
VAYLGEAGRRRLWLPWYLAPSHPPSAFVSLTAGRNGEQQLPPGRCVFYVRTSVCTSDEGRAACDAVEHGPRGLIPVARTTLPAAPSYTGLPYDRPAVEVAISRVEE